MIATMDCFFSIKIMESMFFNWGYGSKEEVNSWNYAASRELKDFLQDRKYIKYW